MPHIDAGSDNTNQEANNDEPQPPADGEPALPSVKKIDTRIDKFVFGGVLFILLCVTLPLIIYPQAGAVLIAEVKLFVTDNFGGMYLALGVVALGFVLYIAFSDIGQIKLGDAAQEREFSTRSWASMLFCAGIGASVLYWGMIEWAYYYQGPPFAKEAASVDAVKWAAAYGIFHWGPAAWAFYLVPAIPIAYFYYVRELPILKVSESMMPVLGENLAHGYVGKMLDIFFVFGMIGGGATTLGLASPLIAEGLHVLLGVPHNNAMNIIVLLITTAIFAYSTYRGLKGGIQLLSNINFYLAMALLIFVFIVGPTVFIINTGLDAIGRVAQNFLRMLTWTEPFANFEEQGFNSSRFPQNWTIFYWAWWIVFAPTVGLFIAKISKGRTLKEMILGSMFYGSLGCAIFFIVLGNYGLYMQLSGELNVVAIINEQSAPAAIFAILNTLPMSKLVVACFTVLAIIFTATTFDSISYILASVVQHEVDEEPHRWNRLFWAFTLCFTPLVLLFTSKDLETLQTASIFAGLPLIIIMCGMMVSTLKAAYYDLHFQPDYELHTIHIDTLPQNSPWELGQTSKPPIGSVHSEQQKTTPKKDAPKKDTSA